MQLLPDVIDARFLIVQGLGVFGFLLSITAMQWLKPRHTILQQAFSSLVFVAHFALLGHPYVAALAGMSSMRDFCSAFIDDKRKQRVVLCFYLLVIYVSAGFYARELSDWFGVLGTTAITASQFFRDRFYLFRGLNFTHQASWTVVYILTQSYFMIIMSVFLVASNAIGVIRFMRLGRSENQIEQ
jgi:hypothetical protein